MSRVGKWGTNRAVRSWECIRKLEAGTAEHKCARLGNRRGVNLHASSYLILISLQFNQKINLMQYYLGGGMVPQTGFFPKLPKFQKNFCFNFL